MNTSLDMEPNSTISHPRYGQVVQVWNRHGDFEIISLAPYGVARHRQILVSNHKIARMDQILTRDLGRRVSKWLQMGEAPLLFPPQMKKFNIFNIPFYRKLFSYCAVLVTPEVCLIPNNRVIERDLSRHTLPFQETRMFASRKSWLCRESRPLPPRDNIEGPSEPITICICVFVITTMGQKRGTIWELYAHIDVRDHRNRSKRRDKWCERYTFGLPQPNSRARMWGGDVQLPRLSNKLKPRATGRSGIATFK